MKKKKFLKKIIDMQIKKTGKFLVFVVWLQLLLTNKKNK